MSTLIVGATIELQPFIRTAFIAMAPLILWFAFLSIGDVIFTRIRHKHKLKMSVKEMKEELKQTEGDPLVKQQQSSFRKALLDGSLEDNVAEANVVITNPVHLAIAIKYEPDEFPAPLIVAKGARKMAEKIKKIARENKVPIVENPPVAQLLYRTVNKGDAIPPKYYQVVAEILAYVMTEGAGSYAV
jgi:flagellar biosynthetic protein FlhB